MRLHETRESRLAEPLDLHAMSQRIDRDSSLETNWVSVHAACFPTFGSSES